jgi:F0F1-type ATP synthase assembly protein I
MSRSDPPGPSPLSQGFAWAYRISAIGFEFVLPAVGGLLADRWLESSPIFTLIGTVLGFSAGLYHLILISRGSPQNKGSST